MSFKLANRNLICKSLSELFFEEIINDALERDEQFYTLHLKNNLKYSFQAKESIWGHLIIDESTLKRNDEKPLLASSFFKETQFLTQMTDITLANFLEELKQTIYSDTHFFNKSPSVSELASKNSLEIESYLNGHPKLLLNKGRIGWNPTEMQQYSPEANSSFKLTRVAIKRDLITVSLSDTPLEKVAHCDLTEFEQKEIERKILEKDLNPHDYLIIPVHPWQWENKIKTFFLKEIEMNEILFLGEFGDLYKPHISLRTLSNQDNESQFDIKLPITILNTSCYRGISDKFVKTAVDLSDTFETILESDDLFKELNTKALKDCGAFSYVGQDYEDIQDAPYRYREMLGGYWRQSTKSKLKEGQKAIMTGALSYVDQSGKSFLNHLIETSSLNIDQWLTQYFNHIVIPLYHLQAKYGIGLVAHGQNTQIILENNRPIGLIVKDFQGDLRLNTDMPEFIKALFNHECLKVVDHLPPHYIVHDLLTGHFVSVLRFLSACLLKECAYPEENFYSTLAHVIEQYEKTHLKQSLIPSLNEETIQKVLLNKVRFSIGYQDQTLRPKPELGSPMKNPLRAKRKKYV
ncbi:IucA/IucC family protein [Halobacteriovorax sp. GB3]|uniref:IucA/IucC family protein n=1 Tax=Halobacteriovorax sp. GB3 TaxID=2719615 RepID=UPI002362233E|nr:IucA/IucC family protein [Halobacteriovorax sp. GB3]MDD0851761.1 IucA/IucC family protein [Halobacteriovorax sp. GB3]